MVSAHIGATFKIPHERYFFKNIKSIKKCEGTIKVSKTDAEPIVQMPQKEFTYSKIFIGDMSLAESVKN